MKLKQVLHPEIVLGLRGNPEATETYKRLLPEISFHEDRQVSVPTHYKEGFDVITLDHLIMAKKFQVERPKVYHIGQDFLLALSQHDQAIPIEYLPERFFGYISFPDKTISDGEDYVQGAYVFVGPGSEAHLIPELRGHRVFWVSYVCESEQGHVGRLCVNLRSVKLDEMIADLRQDNYDDTGRRVDMPLAPSASVVHRTLLNSLLYIHSQKPDLQRAPAVNVLSNSQRRAYKEQTGLENLCKLPVTFVSWKYKRPVTYSVDKTFVRGHFRWQRCGTNYSQIKLAWVTEHERHYTMDKET